MSVNASSMPRSLCRLRPAATPSQPRSREQSSAPLTMTRPTRPRPPLPTPPPSTPPLPIYQEVLARPAPQAPPSARWPSANRRPRLCTPTAVASYLRPWLAPSPQERGLLLCLDPESRPVRLAWLGQGDPTRCIADLRVFARCLVAELAGGNAMQAVIAHNHPSGRLRFSRADRLLTRQARLLAEALGVQLLDHLLLVPDGRWLSLTIIAPALFASAPSRNRGMPNSGVCSRIMK